MRGRDFPGLLLAWMTKLWQGYLNILCSSSRYEENWGLGKFRLCLSTGMLLDMDGMESWHKYIVLIKFP